METAVVKLVASAWCLVAPGSAHLSAVWRLAAVQISQEHPVLLSPRDFRRLSERPVDILRMARPALAFTQRRPRGTGELCHRRRAQRRKSHWPPTTSFQTIRDRFFTIHQEEVCLYAGRQRF